MAQIHLIIDMDDTDYNNEDFLGDIGKIPYITDVEFKTVYLDNNKEGDE